MVKKKRGVKIPRPRRIKFNDPREGYYHVVSRALQKEFRFKEAEKRHLLALLKWLSQVYFVKIATFTILDNHIHLVLQMMREQDISVTAFRARLEKYYAHGFNGLPPDIEQAFRQATLDDLYAHFSDISMFMWDLKLRFARWYNLRYHGYGHVWAERFTSVLLLGRFALRACMIYVELNSVRAGMVPRPESYAFSGLHYLVKGGRHSSWLDNDVLADAVQCLDGGESSHSDLQSQYFQIIYEEGMNQPVTDRATEHDSEKTQGGDFTQESATNESGKSPAKGTGSVFLQRIPGMSKGVFVSDKMTCESLYRKYLPYFRAQQRIRKSKPLIDDNNNSPAPPKPDYLKDLHCLPPPQEGNDRASKDETDTDDKSEQNSSDSV